MEAFHLLSRGGAKFDKQKFKGDVELFNVSNPRAVLQALKTKRCLFRERKLNNQKPPHLVVLSKANCRQNLTSSSTPQAVLLSARLLSKALRQTKRERNAR